MDLALGEVGLTKDVVLRMTWGDLWRTIYGYWIRQDREWDRTRTVISELRNARRRKGSPAKKPTQIMKLAIDRLNIRKFEWTKNDTEQFERAREAWGLKSKQDV